MALVEYQKRAIRQLCSLNRPQKLEQKSIFLVITTKIIQTNLVKKSKKKRYSQKYLR